MPFYTDAEVDKMHVDFQTMRTALDKINNIRNNIIETQTLGWSAHVYPLVEALNKAGFEEKNKEKPMKVIWEPKDIIPGRKYSKKGLGEVWLIGYDSCKSGKTAHEYVSISLNDGMVVPMGSPENMSIHLTGQEYLPIELIGE